MMISKRCKVCGKPATHKFVKIDQNQIYDIYYCSDHASENSQYLKAKDGMALEDILANIMSQEQAAQAAGKGGDSPRCSSCALPFDSYHRTLILGCPDCYESFHDLLVPELRKFHGASKHIGRSPGGEKETSPTTEPATPKQSKPVAVLPAPDPSVTSGGSSLLKNPKAAIKELTLAMNAAIKDEDFEKAALCRDQIQEIEQMPEEKD